MLDKRGFYSAAAFSGGGEAPAEPRLAGRLALHTKSRRYAHLTAALADYFVHYNLFHVVKIEPLNSHRLGRAADKSTHFF